MRNVPAQNKNTIIMLHQIEASKVKTRIDKEGAAEALIESKWLPAFEYTANNIDMIEYDDKVCETCDGEGIQSVLQDCGKTASMCCGGCYEDEECNECGGSGEKEYL